MREDLADSPGLVDSASRLRELVGDESPTLRAWSDYGLALASHLAGDSTRAMDLADAALGVVAAVDVPLEWRCLRVLALASAELGRVEEATSAFGRAASILRPMAYGIENETLRGSFLARPDVAAALDSA